MDSDTMAKIIRDINVGMAPDQSELKYTDEMLAFRSRTEAEFAAFKKAHPNAELTIPNDIEGLA